MRTLRRAVVWLIAFALLTGGPAMSTAAILDGAMMSAPGVSASDHDAPGCGDCEGGTMPVNACVAMCVVLPADLAAAFVLPIQPHTAPAPAIALIRVGRQTLPELHPPQAA